MKNNSTRRSLFSNVLQSRVVVRLLIGTAFLTLCVVAVSWPGFASRLPAGSRIRPSTLGIKAERSQDSVWRDIDEAGIRAAEQRRAGPRSYRTLRLDRAALTQILRAAPAEFSESAKTKSAELSLPMPDGTFAAFRIEASSIMAPELAARFPEIKTYRGQGIDDRTATTRFDLTPQGFHAIVLSPQGTVLIEPYVNGDTANYLVYYQGGVPIDSFACDISEKEQDETNANNGHPGISPDVSSGAVLRTYRLAVGVTAEYTATYGSGTVSGALAAVTTTINLVNAIYERDVAIRLVLIGNETSIIFTDSATDGYTSDNVNALIGENQTNLTNIIGSTNYDIGHVFDGRQEQPGFFSFQGLASLGVVCNSSLKARGVSISRSVQPSSVIAYYSTSHELGHQFGATHTFNATTGNCASQRTAATAYEPGTGSTIMGYRFTCGAEDLMSGDTYFHHASLEQIINFSTGASGGSCPVSFVTPNNIPSVNAGPNYTIPQNTPFTLTASGSDPDGDSLTFCWEEYDLGAASPPSTDDGSRPIFRSFAPTSSPSRTFPRLQDILSGVPTLGESMPVTTRTMNFRATVRDNRATTGGVISAGMQVNVRNDAGPFTVTQPAAGTVWTTENMQTVTWNVANTSNAPVSCARVRILFSTDGGNTFPYLLAANTPNDGSEVVTPYAISGSARVKVEAIGNVFFNISPSFSITGAAFPNIAFGAPSYSVNEGGGDVTVTVTRSSGFGTATVDYSTIDGTASQVADYLITTGTLTFNPGDTSKSFVIPVVDDVYAESSETLTISLNSAAGATLSAANTATLTITDNDGAGPSMPQKRFFAALDGTQETPPNGSAGVGGGIVKLNAGDTAALVGLKFAGLGSAESAAHIHTGPSGVAGPITFGLPTTNPVIDNAWNAGNGLTAQNVTDLKAGNLYLNVHSTNFPNGEIRGQLRWNPILEDAFMVRQHYMDFLNREPDPGGLAFWIGEIHCPQGPTTDQADVQCYQGRTIGVSDSFFFSAEFHETAAYVFLAYRASYGNTQPFPVVDPANQTEANKLPEYGGFMTDRARVLGGASLTAQQQAFANQFVTRPEFLAKYPIAGFPTPATFVAALLANIQAADGVNLSSQQAALETQYSNAGGGTAGRAQVLYCLSLDNVAGNPIGNGNQPFVNAEYNRQFALTLYYGYLRRNPDINGFLFWQGQINLAPVGDVPKQNALVCSFLTSAEYAFRFGPNAPRSNRECP